MCFSVFINFSRYKEDDGDTDQTDSSPTELNSTENSDEPEKNSDLITRLCLCTENSQIYVSPQEKGKAVCYCSEYILLSYFILQKCFIAPQSTVSVRKLLVATTLQTSQNIACYGRLTGYLI